MGLDQYLYARKFVSGTNYGRDAEGNYTSEQNEEFNKIIEAQGLTREDLRDDIPSATIELSVAYWRKVNAVHQWFVDECGDGEDNCQPYYVPREKLVELRDLCQQVLDNPEDAEELLPTQGGFFFGSTEFDEYYIADVKDTVQKLDKVLNNSKFAEWDFQYQASW